ncbi:uncharacterized protein GGS25DRAFT_526093 [Hypoxylon fragiforme]|uniref:uncharacterized protein n=1 Tax=Hypoxylon fragiforme TaxID=63214 RepID=UPI0020C62B1B|nr:uncharacterized protein GGS25DRAFT_526093 [Hypoxylon fragiforme]KAI2603056.1 hypothetical protein GGS25DRAFT_526093 [Hypoxylon fragiforme]
MEDNRGSIGETNSTHSYYTASAAATAATFVTATAVTAPASPSSARAAPGPRIWGLRKGSVTSECTCPSNRGSVALRDSVAYPSSDSTFEASIIKGTAQACQCHPSKPRLIDLDNLRLKVKDLRRSMSRNNSIAEETSSWSRDIELSPPQHIVIHPPTEQRTATDMSNETQSDSFKVAKTRSPSLLIPPKRFRDKIRSKHFNRTPENLELECPGHTEVQNERRIKGVWSPCCVIL